MEEQRASEEASRVQELAAICETQLAEAYPALQDAEKALATLNKKNMAEMKGMKNPPKPGKAIQLQ